MKLTDRFAAGNDRFEGDRTLALRSIPAHARILRATVTVTPIDNRIGDKAFAETITFTNNQGDLGAVKTPLTDWVEVDFHARRTLSRVRGNNLAGASLQIDIGGGAYIEINDKGAFKAPGDALFTLPAALADGAFADLPGLTITKLKLTKATANPDIIELIIRSVPTNFSLKLGSSPPFFLQTGEMTQPQTSSDFSEVLQAFLAEAEIENGFYLVPLIMHSDAIARVELFFEIEYANQQNALSSGLGETTLPFDYSSLPNAASNVVQVSLPANARVLPGETRARVVGAFDETRVVYGPTGVVSPAGAAAITPALMQAQLISLDTAVAAFAIDLLLTSVSRVSRLKLDLRDDLDGKPDEASLLPAAVEIELNREIAGRPTWISAPLLTEFQFRANTQRRYWLVLQSLEGEAAWSANSAAAGSVAMQRSDNGGLSWRESTATGVTGPLAALFRLRNRPSRFQMPITLQVGEGERAQQVSLDRFQPLGRVELNLDFPEVADAFNQFLSNTAAATCLEAEHVLNGNFEEWVRMGDQIGNTSSIQLGSIPRAIAVAPDGALAYVLSGGGDSRIRIIDVICDRMLDEELTIDEPSPETLRISPDGSRLYALVDGDKLYLIDTDTFRALGFVQLAAAPQALAISPDGQVLYLSQLSQGFPTPIPNSIHAYDTAKLERVISGALASLDLALNDTIRLTSELEPTALAVSPNRGELYAAVPKNDATGVAIDGELHIIDTATFTSIGSPITLGRLPSAIALTPNGETALVTNEGSNNLSIIDVTRRVVAGPPIAVGLAPSAVAVTPDGARAFVANHEENTLTVIDILQQNVLETITLTSNDIPLEVAVTPQGDRVFAPIANDTYVAAIPLGLRVPLEWELTSGTVALLCGSNSFRISDSFRLVTLLAGVSLSDLKTPQAAALSQVTPAVGGCFYDFSFFGAELNIGRGSDATFGGEAFAEVIWYGASCGFLRTDRVPIAVVNAAAQRTASLLQLHRVRLLAPAEATQAEIRFNVPPGGMALLDRVSLRSTVESLANDDLRFFQNGRPTNWLLSPDPAPGFSVLSQDEAVVLRNGGAGAVVLSQTAALEPNQSFTLNFTGRSQVQAGSSGNPRVELAWRNAANAPLGAPTRLEIPPSGSERLALATTSPTGAAQAEIRLVLPARTTLEVKQISLRPEEQVSVPITFIAQAPGQLTISDFNVAYELIEASPPLVPAEGLCSPTPPDRLPGEQPCDCCFCHGCGEEREMAEADSRLTAGGRPLTVGNCPECGAMLVRHGGPFVAHAEALLLPRIPLTRNRRAFRSFSSRRTGKDFTTIPLTAIAGINPAAQ